MRNSIVVVVVTYNRKDLLIECIDHLLDLTYGAFDVLEIDNHSTDDAYSHVKELVTCRALM